MLNRQVVKHLESKQKTNKIMTRSLPILTSSLFVIFSIMTFAAFGQNANQLETRILNANKELIITVVDVEGFAEQDDMAVGYKPRYYANVEWLQQNWYEFSKSVREKKSYKVKLNTETYKALSDSEKSKLQELFETCYANTFDPISIAASQLSSIKYSLKYSEGDEQIYQKQQLTEKDIESHSQNQTTTVLLLNTKTADQIKTILKK